MPDPSPIGEPPAQFISDLQTRTFQSAVGLMCRRSQAAADYIRALPSVRQPSDLVALQMSYWTHLLEDYSSAMSESLTPLEEFATETKAASSKPQRSQAAA